MCMHALQSIHALIKQQPIHERTVELRASFALSLKLSHSRFAKTLIHAHQYHGSHSYDDLFALFLSLHSDDGKRMKQHRSPTVDSTDRTNSQSELDSCVCCLLTNFTSDLRNSTNCSLVSVQRSEKFPYQLRKRLEFDSEPLYELNVNFCNKNNDE